MVHFGWNREVHVCHVTTGAGTRATSGINGTPSAGISGEAYLIRGTQLCLHRPGAEASVTSRDHTVKLSGRA